MLAMRRRVSGEAASGGGAGSAARCGASAGLGGAGADARSGGGEGGETAGTTTGELPEQPASSAAARVRAALGRAFIADFVTPRCGGGQDPRATQAAASAGVDRGCCAERR